MGPQAIAPWCGRAPRVDSGKPSWQYTRFLLRLRGKPYWQCFTLAVLAIRRRSLTEHGYVLVRRSEQDSATRETILA